MWLNVVSAKLKWGQCWSAVFTDYVPQVFVKLQMIRTCSERSCNFELQIVHLWQFAPPLLSFLACHGNDRGWEVSPLSVTVWRCLEVVSALWVALDTCVPCSRLAFCLAPPPPTFMGTFLKLTYWRWVKYILSFVLQQNLLDAGKEQPIWCNYM